MHPASFGSCRVVDQISSGSITSVYKAIQEPIGRTVAVKALKATISTSSPFSEALAREARILAMMRHETLPRVIEFVRNDDAMWLALELCDGFTLREVLTKVGSLDPAAACAVAIEVSRALLHIHDRGVVHANLDPSNVLVARDGSVMLIDFASAQAADLPSSPVPVEGETALALPSYMSPEQILGEPIDGRADIFSLRI